MLSSIESELTTLHLSHLRLLNRNCKLEISTAPTKAKSREPAYSQALVQNKIDRQWVRSRESGRQASRQSDGYGGWCLKWRWGGRYREKDKGLYWRRLCDMLLLIMIMMIMTSMIIITMV